MITKKEYDSLVIELKEIAPIIPKKWGYKQSNDLDKFDDEMIFFKIYSFDLLKEKCDYLLKTNPDFTESIRDYYYHRWFTRMISIKDEHHFSSIPNVVHNPIDDDKNWDIEFYLNPELRFDIKSGKMPENYLSNIEYALKNPNEVCYFQYDNQSNERRLGYQNRLFIIHHSYRTPNDDFNVRLNFDIKEIAFQEYVKRLENKNYKLFDIHLEPFNQPEKNLKSDIIWIFENMDGTFSYKIASEIIN